MGNAGEIFASSRAVPQMKQGIDNQNYVWICAHLVR